MFPQFCNRSCLSSTSCVLMNCRSFNLQNKPYKVGTFIHITQMGRPRYRDVTFSVPITAVMGTVQLQHPLLETSMLSYSDLPGRTLLIFYQCKSWCSVGTQMFLDLMLHCYITPFSFIHIPCDFRLPSHAFIRALHLKYLLVPSQVGS